MLFRVSLLPLQAEYGATLVGAFFQLRHFSPQPLALSCHPLRVFIGAIQILFRQPFLQIADRVFEVIQPLLFLAVEGILGTSLRDCRISLTQSFCSCKNASSFSSRVASSASRMRSFMEFVSFKIRRSS